MIDVDVDGFEIELSKLDLRDGDTVLWRTPPGFAASASAESARQIKDLLNKHHSNITVLVVPHGHNLERVDEDAMASLGWVRPPRRQPPRRKKESNGNRQKGPRQEEGRAEEEGSAEGTG